MPSSDPEDYGDWVRTDLAALRRETAPGGDGTPFTLGKYVAESRLGEGAAAVVYRARDAELGRPVAIKVLRDLLGTNPSVRERFHREARIAAGLSHPNVVAVYDKGEIGGQLYIVMELVEGAPLNDAIRRPDRDLRAMARILEKVARGVGAAHAAGVVHRDLKPANILVGRDGEPKVGDFGLAHVLGGGEGLTRTGAVMGTPLYMSPEQVRGKSGEITPRTDVYALGAILYEAVTGRPPFPGDSVTEIYGRIVHGEPIPPRRINPRIPRDLETIALKAMDLDPGRRYATAAELAEELRRFLAGEPILTRPAGAVRRLWRSALRRKAAILPLLVAAAAVMGGGAWAWREALRTRAQEEALGLLEKGRIALDAAADYLYHENADYAELVRRVEKGQDLIERAVGKAPTLPSARYLLGRAWEIRGWEDRAEEHWRKALALDPAFTPARYRLGRMLMIRAFLLELESREPGRESVRERALRIMKEARTEIDAAVAPGGGLEDPMQVELAGIMSLYLRGEPGEACAKARQGITTFKGARGEEEFHWLLSAASTGEERLSAVNEAIRIRPKYAVALCCRGLTHSMRAPLEVVAADYTAALELSPRMALAYVMRGDEEAVRGAMEPALADYSKALEIDPTIAVAYVNRGYVKTVLGDFDGAVADCDRAIEMEPHFSKAFLNRGNAKQRRRDLDGALADFEAALRYLPRYAKARIGRAQIKVDHKDPEGAIADCDAALEIDPRIPEGYFIRARAELMLGRTDRMLADLQKVLELAPPPSPLGVRVRRMLEEKKSEPGEW